MQKGTRAPRRRHADELKARVLAACAEPGASVAAVAQAHGLNANLVHKWRRGGGAQMHSAARPVRSVVTAGAEFIALALPATADADEPEPAEFEVSDHGGRFDVVSAESGVFVHKYHIKGTAFVSVQPSHLDSRRSFDEGVHLFRRWTPCRRDQGRQGGGTQMS